MDRIENEINPGAASLDSDLSHGEYCLDKVTAFLTRGEDQDVQILLFRHPTGGIQLPAGTAVPAEPPEMAVLREVEEKTGLKAVRLISELGREENVLPEDERVLLVATHLQGEPGLHNPPNDTTLKRGLTVKLLDTRGNYSQVCYQEVSIDEQPSVLTREVVGWLPNSLMCRRIRRFFYQLGVDGETPHAWKHTRYPFTIPGFPESAGLVHQVYWTALVPRPGLAPIHDHWLQAYCNKIKN